MDVISELWISIWKFQIIKYSLKKEISDTAYGHKCRWTLASISFIFLLISEECSNL